MRSLLNSPQYPTFICPNCRAGADLEAEVDELAEEWVQLKSLEAEAQAQVQAQAAPHADAESEAEAEAEEETEATAQAEITAALPVTATGTSTPEPSLTNDNDAIDAMDATVSITPEALQRAQMSHAVSEPLPIRNAASGVGRSKQIRDSRSPSPPEMTNGAEGPITPRNNAGPWVFDGSAGRNSDAPSELGMRSLDAAAGAGARHTSHTAEERESK